MATVRRTLFQHVSLGACNPKALAYFGTAGFSLLVRCGEIVNDITARIADIHHSHTSSGAEGCVSCWCGETFESFTQHSQHVAEQIVAQLQLTPEWRGDPTIRNGNSVYMPVPTPREERFATPWVVVEGEK